MIVQVPSLLDAAELSSMIAQTTFAAATDDARPVFTGVLARVADGQLTLAIGDSRDAFRFGRHSRTLAHASVESYRCSGGVNA